MTGPNRRKLIAEVNEMRTSEGTVWSNPVLIGKKLDPAPAVVFFLTDGLTADYDIEKTYELVTNWRKQNRDLRVNTIALGDPRAADGMEQIARRTGGQFRMINSKKDIDQLAQN